MKTNWIIIGLTLLFFFITVPKVFSDAGAKHQTLQAPSLLELGVMGGNEYDLVPDLNGDGLPDGCYIGTLGGLVSDTDSTGIARYYILSNNHALARSNSSSIGEPIMHNVSSACSTNSIQIATLISFKPITFSGVNYVDAAIAEINYTKVSTTGTIMDIGLLNPTIATPKLRMKVKKSGTTTGVTTSKINSIGVNVNVDYGVKGVATFFNQISISGSTFSASGDSGSLIVTNSDTCAQPIALLFAGGANSTIASPITNVLQSLDAELKNGGTGLKIVGETNLTVCSSGSGDGSNGGGGKGRGVQLKKIDTVSRALHVRNVHEAALANVPGFVGTGIGVGDEDEDVVIEVYVEKLTPGIQRMVPKGLKGVHVKVVETGKIFAY